ncbi:MAG: hypothetical protein M9913_10515 [Bryobacteraceae bacterium]|nr:hypothetical protein [Solibacteraceae bacterium]MCO5351314.1 hypothetical protein [Bryobacteraceae bacterium]
MAQQDEGIPGEFRLPEDGAAYVVTACLLLGLAGIAGFNDRSPTVHSPMPVLTVFVTVMGLLVDGSSGGVAFLLRALVGPVLLIMWHPYIFMGEHAVPKRSVVALGVLTGLSTLHLAVTWDGGVRYQGLGHTMGVIVLNALAALLSWCFLLRARRRREFGMTLAAHALMVGWLVYCAFPWLGEGL